MNREQVFESSRTVRLLRAASPGSMVPRALRQFVGRLPIFFSDIQRERRAFDDGPVIAVIEGSVLVRTAVALLARIDCAAGHSRSARIVETMRQRAAVLNGAQRIRLGALTLFSAVVVHLLMTGFNAPEPSVIARTVWVALLAILATVMAGARSLAAAWNDWSRRGPRNESDLVSRNRDT